ncbi:Protein of unknown function [Cyclobacterium lianum]|uniref:DUF4230 domain-containing protein n=1 Tax=Cyclobacterium lianum TaxID=388280 RepID=A0A1M7QGS4_9BACT|nr:DUF4230 domain-containing protein [Cyclobacterium lianum]SHN30294.1 Protein of unknown function [Cyclobacterium lianum]
MANIKRKGMAIGLLLILGFSACEKDERGMVIGKIQQASDLVVSEFVVDKVVFGKKTRNLLFIPVNEASFLAYSRAKIKTGIDLEKITEQDIEIDERKITLRLPPIEVINFSYPPEDFVEDSLISNPDRFLNEINLEDQETFFRMAEMDIRDNLPHMGLLSTSQDHARKLIHMVLKSFDFEEIYIHFKSDSLLIRQVNSPENLMNP